MTRLTREDCGNLVFEALSDADPTWQEACDMTGITRRQFNRGVAYVKDILAEEHNAPLMYDPSTGRYSLALSGDEEHAKAYERLRLLILRKQLGRLITGTAAPAVEAFGSVASRRMLRYLKGAEEELDLLLAEAGHTLF